MGNFARIVASHKHRVSTVSIHQDALIVVRQGRKTLLRAGSVLEASPGEALALARGTVWDVINDPAGSACYEAHVLVFGEALLTSFWQSRGGDMSPSLADGVRLQVCGSFEDSVMRVADQLKGRTVSDQLLFHWLEEVLIHLGEHGVRYSPLKELDWAERVRRVVSQSPGAGWTLASLAEKFHVSASTLQRRLADEGRTVAALVREVRLELALGMLQTTAMPIGEVAMLCGWQSHSRFSAAFLERWGFSPSQLRKSS